MRAGAAAQALALSGLLEAMVIIQAAGQAAAVLPALTPGLAEAPATQAVALHSRLRLAAPRAAVLLARAAAVRARTGAAAYMGVRAAEQAAV